MITNEKELQAILTGKKTAAFRREVTNLNALEQLMKDYPRQMVKVFMQLTSDPKLIRELFKSEQEFLIWFDSFAKGEVFSSADKKLLRPLVDKIHISAGIMQEDPRIVVSSLLRNVHRAPQEEAIEVIKLIRRCLPENKHLQDKDRSSILIELKGNFNQYKKLNKTISPLLAKELNELEKTISRMAPPSSSQFFPKERQSSKAAQAPESLSEKANRPKNK